MNNQNITITLKPEEIEIVTDALRRYADEMWRSSEELERVIRKVARTREDSADIDWKSTSIACEALDDRNTLADRLASKIEAVEWAECKQH